MKLYKVQYRLFKGVHEVRVWIYNATESDKVYSIPSECKRIFKNRIGKITDDITVNDQNRYGRVCWLTDISLVDDIIRRMKIDGEKFVQDFEIRIKTLKQEQTAPINIVYKDESADN